MALGLFELQLHYFNSNQHRFCCLLCKMDTVTPWTALWGDQAGEGT